MGRRVSGTARWLDVSKTVQRLNYDPEEIVRAERRQRAEQVRTDLKQRIEESLAKRVGAIRRVKA